MGAENLAPTGIRSPDRPDGSESLYRQSYPRPRGGKIPLVFRLSTKCRLRGQIYTPATLSLVETQVTIE
jgi:hypothetical protein